MIVVGVLAPGPEGERAAAIARRAAAAGARAEVVGVASADTAGDALLLELASASVGHATVIRSPAEAIEPADLDLALRYLPDVRVIVLAGPDEPLVAVAEAAASWSGATIVAVGPVRGAGSATLVLDPPAKDPDETFAGFVAALAVRLDAGEPPDAAWKATLAALVVDRVG
jgi:hypothetical protein